ncbi:hypothetical protein C8R44DRAFT_872851 [Mycena epipterygia]|nr:hypothetical protein C8R44DRAFT_872851 [Mycena epipterygia]
MLDAVQQVPPKPLLPVAITEYLATTLPDASPQQQQDLFDGAINTEGGFEAAVTFSNVSTTSPLLVSLPANAEVNYTDVGPFTIFYHSTYPHHQENNQFMRNFYIGRRGQGIGSIMPDWAQQGIVVRISDGLAGEG